MLALIHGQWFDVTPIPEPEGDLTADVENDRVIVRKGGKRVDIGPVYHHWGQNGSICPKTGVIYDKRGKVRVVLGENAWNLPLETIQVA